jgi:hypothetical protein
MICQTAETNYIEMLICEEKTKFLKLNVFLKLLAVLFWERRIYPLVVIWSQLKQHFISVAQFLL